jgi:hypothetical protein
VVVEHLPVEGMPRCAVLAAALCATSRRILLFFVGTYGIFTVVRLN